MSDIDVGEQFYNFLLHSAVKPHCGIDLAPYFSELTTWERWTRCVMSLKSSPHGCIRMEMLGDEISKGCYHTPDNPSYFDQVRLNVPGSPTYNPSLPWVSKVDSRTGRSAGDVVSYVDDKRSLGSSHAHCTQVTRQMASMMIYLGEQDASRKRVAPSERAGAWTGAVCHTDEGKVTVMVTQDKWDKAKGYIAILENHLNRDNTFKHKELERIRCFLTYVIHTYPCFTSYLKGIHLTLDRWRKNRDHDGWRIANMVHYHLDAECTPNALPSSVCARCPATAIRSLCSITVVLHAASPMANRSLITSYGGSVWVR